MSAAEPQPLAILRADLGRAVSAMLDAENVVRGRLVGGKVPGEPDAMAFIAVTLSHWYNAFEDALARIARTIDGGIPSGSDWHVELIRRATLDLEELRPPVFDRAHLGDVREVLRFRHFLRHAYGVRLDASKLQIAVDAMLRVEAGLQAGLEQVLALVDALVRASP
jgi:hypothetical protein